MLRASLVVVLAVFAAACTSRPGPTVRKGRIISITDSIASAHGVDTVRFGHLRSGEIAEIRLWIANDTPRPVALISYERSCGCTTLEFDAKPITPGDAQRVILRYDSRGEQGWQLRTLDIALAGATRPVRIIVEAEVE